MRLYYKMRVYMYVLQTSIPPTLLPLGNKFLYIILKQTNTSTHIGKHTHIRMKNSVAL